MSEDEEIDNSWWEQILACFDDDMLCIKHARFVFLCQQQEAQLADARKEIEQLRARVAEQQAMLRWVYECQMKQLVKPLMQFDEWLWEIKTAQQREREREQRG